MVLFPQRLNHFCTAQMWRCLMSLIDQNCKLEGKEQRAKCYRAIFPCFLHILLKAGSQVFAFKFVCICVHRMDWGKLLHFSRQQKTGESRDFWRTRSCPPAPSALGGHKHDEDLLLRLLIDIFKTITLPLPSHWNLLLGVQLGEAIVVSCTQWFELSWQGDNW